jgi:hypothetical protein
VHPDKWLHKHWTGCHDKEWVIALRPDLMLSLLNVRLPTDSNRCDQYAVFIALSELSDIPPQLTALRWKAM